MLGRIHGARGCLLPSTGRVVDWPCFRRVKAWEPVRGWCGGLVTAGRGIGGVGGPACQLVAGSRGAPCQSVPLPAPAQGPDPGVLAVSASRVVGGGFWRRVWRARLSQARSAAPVTRHAHDASSPSTLLLLLLRTAVWMRAHLMAALRRRYQ